MIALLLAPGFCNPSICATAPFHLGSCAVMAAAVPLLVPLQWWSWGTSRKRVFHEYISLDMLMARVVYPFVHYPVQYQVNQESLCSVVKNRAGTAAQPAGPVYCFSQQSHWMLERKSKIAQSYSSEYPPMSPAVGGRGFLSQRLWGRQQLPACPAETASRSDSDARQLPRHSDVSEHWVKEGRENRCLSLQRAKYIKFGETQEKKCEKLLSLFVSFSSTMRCLKFFAYSYTQ